MRRPAILLTAAVVAVLSGLSGCAQGGPHTLARATTGAAAASIPGWRVPPGQFVSLRFAPADERTSGPSGFLEVALSDVTTGALVRRLLPATTRATCGSPTARDSSTAVISRAAIRTPAPATTS
jgi:hypothetical protein